jgi:hypothetical protein
MDLSIRDGRFDNPRPGSFEPADLSQAQAHSNSHAMRRVPLRYVRDW